MNRWPGMILVILLSVPLSANATYTTHFQNGRNLQKQGHHVRAVQEFDRALKIAPRPGARYYKAMSLIELKRFIEAIKLLSDVMKHPDTPQVVKDRIPGKLSLIARLQQQRTEMKPVPLTVVTPGVRGARVALNGNNVGFTPYTSPLTPGRYQLAIRRAGYQPHVENLVLKQGKPLTVKIALKPLPVPIRVSVPSNPGADVLLDGKPIGKAPLTLQRLPGKYRLEILAPGRRPHRETLIVLAGKPLRREIALIRTASHGPTRTGLRLGAYITGGIGLAILVAGGVLTGLSVKENNAAKDPDLFQVDAQSKRDSARKKEKAAWALYGIGGAALLSGIIMLVVDLTRKPQPKLESRDKAGLQILIHPNGVSLFQRF